MLNSKKFTFGESFLNEAGKVIVPEVEHAREQGHAAGYEAGYAQAKSELEADVAAMLAVLNSRMAELVSNQQAAYEFVTSSTLSVVKAIIQKVIPYSFEKFGDHEVQCFVDEVMKGLQASGVITIFVHADLQKVIEDKVQGYEGLKVVVKKDDLERTDCRIIWDDGGVEQIRSKLLQEIDQALARVMGNVPQPIVENSLEGEENGG